MTKIFNSESGIFSGMSVLGPDTVVSHSGAVACVAPGRDHRKHRFVDTDRGRQAGRSRRCWEASKGMSSSHGTNRKSLAMHEAMDPIFQLRTTSSNHTPSSR